MIRKNFSEQLAFIWK